VVYMAVASLAQLCEKLVEHGLPAATPAAVVENATKPEQRVIAGTLADLAQLAARGNAQSPSLAIVGGVVGLRDKLAWFTRGRAAP